MSSFINVPFLDLKAQHAALKDELIEVFSNAIDNAAFVGGAELQSFEEEFASFCQTKYAVGVASGTDALMLALKAIDVEAGETVVTVPNSFFATTEAITHVGAKIEFVDVDPDTKLMDPVKLEKHLAQRDSNSKLAAIIPVHLYGQVADMDAINQIAQKYNAKVIEDSAQAHGALYKGKPAGGFGSAACFSFYAGKNLGACGEAGAICTNDEEIAKKIKMLREHGQEKKHVYKYEGYNARMDAIQAGFLRIKLPYLPGWNKKRQDIAGQFDRAFNALDGIRPVTISTDNKSVHHLYVVFADNRDSLADYLGEHNIACGHHYPEPLHLMDVYSRLQHKRGDFPVAEKAAEQLLSLPIYPEMTQEQINHVIQTVSDWVKNQ